MKEFAVIIACYLIAVLLFVTLVQLSKANFEPSPIGLTFSGRVKHYKHCTKILFIWINSIFSFLFLRESFPGDLQTGLGRL